MITEATFNQFQESKDHRILRRVSIHPRKKKTNKRSSVQKKKYSKILNHLWSAQQPAAGDLRHRAVLRRADLLHNVQQVPRRFVVELVVARVRLQLLLLSCRHRANAGVRIGSSVALKFSSQPTTLEGRPRKERDPVGSAAVQDFPLDLSAEQIILHLADDLGEKYETKGTRIEEKESRERRSVSSKFLTGEKKKKKIKRKKDF